MRRVLTALATVLVLGLLASGARAETLELLDGTTVAGDVVLPGSADGLNIRLFNGKYQKIPWDNFSPSALEKLAKNPALASFVNPLLSKPEDSQTDRSEIIIQQPERLQRLDKGSLVGALFQSPVGLVALLLVYAAGIYAGYEISVVRSYPPLLVCGVCAVAPFVGQILFLCLPTRMVAPEENAGPVVKESARAEAQWTPTFHAKTEDKPRPARKEEPPEEPEENQPAAQEVPETQVFAKGQFMFNRRFFETKFPGFFSLVRKDADKHMIIYIRSARGEFEARRISKITANELFVDGSTNPIPFIEILEVQLKHESA